MEGSSYALNVLRFHPGVGRIYQAGFSRRQVDDCVRNNRDKKQQDNTLAYAFDNELGHVTFSQVCCVKTFLLNPSPLGRGIEGIKIFCQLFLTHLYFINGYFTA